MIENCEVINYWMSLMPFIEYYTQKVALLS